MVPSLRWKGAAFTVPFQLGFVLLYLVPIGYAVYQSLFRTQQSGLGLGGATDFWYMREGVRIPVGRPLDTGRLSDDHGGRLRFTGTLAGTTLVTWSTHPSPRTSGTSG